MTTQAQLIEDVVQNVLRELRSKCSTDSSAAAPAPAVSNVVLIDDAVVTESSLAGRITGLREVVFTAGTVLTPSAKDFLRRQKVSWTRSGAAVGSGVVSSVPTGPKVVATHSTVAVGSAFNGGSLSRVGVKEAAQVVGDAIGDGTVLVLTANPHSLAIELNRSSEIRAVAIDEVGTTTVVVKAANANCVCVKPNGRNKEELKKLAKTISSCGCHR